MLKTHKYYKTKLIELESKESELNSENQNSRLSVDEVKTLNEKNKNRKDENDETLLLDTVGAIVLDSNGRLASAVSSGGILLKLPGRVGHASMFGCGCWVCEDVIDERRDPDKRLSIACCTTGSGEYIIKTLFAKECCDHVLKNRENAQYSLDEFFENKFFSMKIYSHLYIYIFFFIYFFLCIVNKKI
jgi:taspase, threonine aspartase, 1